MSSNMRVMNASPAQVWEVLADGWLYPLWVVGAARVRDVDSNWPAVGSRIEHSVGLWPLLLDDNTEVTECAPGTSLTLRARAWPAGEARVRLRVTPDAAGAKVTITEDVTSGPGKLVPPPLRGITLKWRNAETLRRLSFLVEQRPIQAANQ